MQTKQETARRAIRETKDESCGENTMAMYLKEIHAIPLLTREEEDGIARQAASGDQKALNKLVRANLRFVINIAKNYQGKGLPLQDLISEGNIGLINAASKFDADLGFHFISYAVWWVRQAILKALAEKSRMIRLPANKAAELKQIEAELHEVESSLNEPKLKHIARRMNRESAYVQNLLSVSRDLISLDTPLTMMQDAGSLMDHIEDDTFVTPDDTAINHSLREDIEGLLKQLDRREAAVLRCRYGLANGAPMSLREVGDELKLTKERIRQIENKALVHLRHADKKQKRLQHYVA